MIKLNGIELPTKSGGVNIRSVDDIKNDHDANGGLFHSGVSKRTVIEVTTAHMVTDLADSFNNLALGNFSTIDPSDSYESIDGLKLGAAAFGGQVEMARELSPGSIGGAETGIVYGGLFSYETLNQEGAAWAACYESLSSGNHYKITTVRGDSTVNGEADGGDGIQFAVGDIGGGVYQYNWFSLNVAIYNMVFFFFDAHEYILDQYRASDFIWPRSGLVWVESDGESYLCEGEVVSMEVMECYGDISYSCKYKFEEVEDVRLFAK